MRYTHAIRWALLYRAIATASFLAGVALVGMGLVAGFGTAVSTVATDPLRAGEAVGQVDLAVTALFTLLGIVVWQLGNAFGLFVALPRATGRRAAKSFDANRVRSDVLDALDDRLTDMEAEIRETRRSVQELKRAEHAAAFDEADVPTSDGAATPERTEAPAADPSERVTGSPDAATDRSDPPSETGSASGGDDASTSSRTDG